MVKQIIREEGRVIPINDSGTLAYQLESKTHIKPPIKKEDIIWPENFGPQEREFEPSIESCTNLSFGVLEKFNNADELALQENDWMLYNSFGEISDEEYDLLMSANQTRREVIINDIVTNDLPNINQCIKEGYLGENGLPLPLGDNGPT